MMKFVEEVIEQAEIIKDQEKQYEDIRRKRLDEEFLEEINFDTFKEEEEQMLKEKKEIEAQENNHEEFDRLMELFKE